MLNRIEEKLLGRIKGTQQRSENQYRSRKKTTAKKKKVVETSDNGRMPCRANPY